MSSATDYKTRALESSLATTQAALKLAQDLLADVEAQRTDELDEYDELETKYELLRETAARVCDAVIKVATNGRPESKKRHRIRS
jgi:hypothetical protein